MQEAISIAVIGKESLVPADKVHQTLTLDDRNSAYAPALLKWECHNDLDLLVVENRSYDDLTHRRSVLFVDKRYFVIIDEAYGSAAGDVELHFQLAPGEPIVDKKRYSIETSYPEGWNLFLKCSREMGEMELREEEGWVSACIYGEGATVGLLFPC